MWAQKAGLHCTYKKTVQFNVGFELALYSINRYGFLSVSWMGCVS